MSAYVLLNLLNELRNIYNMQCLPNISSLFHNEFDKFNKSGARMLDCIKTHYWRESTLFFSSFTQR